MRSPLENDAFPAGILEPAVMMPAHQGEVVDIGGAAIAPPDDVMGLAPGRRDGAAGERAATVAGRESAALGGLGQSRRPTEAELAADIIKGDEVDLGGVGESQHRRRRYCRGCAARNAQMAALDS